MVRLEVACQGEVISKPVIFQYKDPGGASNSPSTRKMNTLLKEKDLRTILLRKLESLDICTVEDKDIFLEKSLDTEASFRSVFFFLCFIKLFLGELV